MPFLAWFLATDFIIVVGFLYFRYELLREIAASDARIKQLDIEIAANNARIEQIRIQVEERTERLKKLHDPAD